MKNKTLKLLACLGILYSCGDKKNETKGETIKDYVIINGNIKTDGSDAQDMYLVVDPLAIDNTIVKKIFLDEKGNFNDSIFNIKEGYYVFMSNDKKAINLYLKKGDNIDLRTNALSKESFLDSLHVKGNKESVFLTDYEKFKIRNFNTNVQDLFSLSEDRFKNTLDSLKLQSLAYVENYKDVSNKVKKITKDDIIYGWGLIMNNYPFAHAQLTKDLKFKPSEKFYEFTKEFDLDNVELFKSNSKYKNYVSQEINRIITKDYSPNDNENQIDYFVRKLKEDSIKPYIKDYMLVQLANQGVFQPAPTYEQYQKGVLQNVQAQIQALKKQNPNVKIPASATPTKEKLQEEYKKYIEEFNKFYDESYNKVLDNVNTIEFKKVLEENNLIIKGLNKEDKAPSIEVITDGNETDLIDLYKGKNILVYFWSASAENTTLFFEEYNKLVEEFKNENITFITVNIDLLNKQDKWKLTIKEKNIKGEHFFATDDWDTKFIKSYGFDIRPFPRFVIINKDGNIHSFDAPTPKDKELKNQLNELINQ